MPSRCVHHWQAVSQGLCAGCLVQRRMHHISLRESTSGKNKSIEFLQTASATTCWSCSSILETASKTFTMPLPGSFRPFTSLSIEYFFLSTAAGIVFTKGALACVGLGSHQGASVSSNSLSRGSCEMTFRFSSVFIEHPLIPILKPGMPRTSWASCSVPSNECTTPVVKLSGFARRMASKSAQAARMCRNSGSLDRLDSSSCFSNHLSWVSLLQKFNLSLSSPNSPTATTFPHCRPSLMTSISAAIYASGPSEYFSNSSHLVGCTPTVLNSLSSVFASANAFRASCRFVAVMMIRSTPEDQARSSTLSKSGACALFP
mmetsp:Transcript_14634/g.44214  ORF Transcript_14634/g.44214 Transcript_14634/m.44214 type:complete len:317 (+) Transcript_14634:1080-2030(+)